MSLTSDDAMFHTISDNIGKVLIHAAQANGAFVNPEHVGNILLVIRSDNSAEIWADTATIVLDAVLNRPAQGGTALYQRDVSDISGMWFPEVSIAAEDRILCLFRVKWSFALFFDFGCNGLLDISAARRDLGTLYRRLFYRHLYEMMDNEVNMDRLAMSGWFPFAEIVGSEFSEIARHFNSGLSLSSVEDKILDSFSDDRVEKVFSRWMTKPEFRRKEAILRPAIEAFKRGESVLVLKTLLTEIEGILQFAHRERHGKSAGGNLKLLEFSKDSAIGKVGIGDSLLFPESFFRYLDTYIFKNFDPDDVGDIASRHAVGHGAASAESYTQTRALQAILTLDQFAFYF